MELTPKRVSSRFLYWGVYNVDIEKIVRDVCQQELRLISEKNLKIINLQIQKEISSLHSFIKGFLTGFSIALALVGIFLRVYFFTNKKENICFVNLFYNIKLLF